MSFDLRTERIQRGKSIRGLAAELEVHEASIRRLEAGEGVHLATAKTVADYFGVTVLDVMPQAAAA